MTFFVQTRWGGSERSPSAERMRAILAELDAPDDEHPDAWLTHESGWTLSADQHGRLVLENVESEVPPRHMRGVPRERVLALWLQLATGKIEDVERATWEPGYGNEPLTEAHRAKLDAERLALDRGFYDSLGRSETHRDAKHRSARVVRFTRACSVACISSRTRRASPARSRTDRSRRDVDHGVGGTAV